MCTQPLKKKTIKTEFKDLICSLNNTICDAEKWIDKIVTDNKLEYGRNHNTKNRKSSSKN